ncbi:CPBP family intramembrane glutamic endopeptidase [Pseudaestuariivita rosea]|uniref:CPBP family intramembrane glutamic endopeptidase n=1 Tax=Pseudaestuariivita rosea TaxID=2763263 RepID=UPI001ABBD029|nr:CPBP family intramembrane glutamic endopeptidase [Pseudaestuariivita rosea]
MNYSNHDFLVEPARTYPQFWRTALGMVLSALFYIALIAVFFGAMALTIPDSEVLPALADPTAPATPGSTMAMLYSFVCMMLAVVLSALIMHRRGLATLLGPWDMLISDFFRVMGVLLVLSFITTLLPPYGGDDPAREPTQNMAVNVWLWLLPFTFLGILIQVSAEEIVFRGYLQSQLAARFKNPVIWMLAPALIFGSLHFAPSMQGGNAIVVAIWATLFGVIAADLTARAGNLGPAIAMHFINNFIGIAVFSAQGPLSGLALYVYPFGMDDPELRAFLPMQFLSMLVAWLAACLAIRR